jgi:hypothetical protein
MMTPAQLYDELHARERLAADGPVKDRYKEMADALDALLAPQRPGEVSNAAVGYVKHYLQPHPDIAPIIRAELSVNLPDGTLLYACSKHAEAPKAFRELIEACEAEYCNEDTEVHEPDDSKVAFPEDTCAITFGHIRRARAALAQGPQEEVDVPDGMWKISKLIDKLSSIHKRFGDTCVWMKECSWGASALHAQYRAALAATPQQAEHASASEDMVLVPKEAGDVDAFMVLNEYRVPGRTRKEAYRVAIRKLSERAKETLATDQTEKNCDR